jgi:hypothetical protein
MGILPMSITGETPVPRDPPLSPATPRLGCLLPERASGG